MQKKQARQQQILILAVLASIIMFMLGIILGFGIAGRRNKAGQPPPVLAAYHEAGLGISRDGMAQVLEDEASGAYAFELEQGRIFDYYRGTSEQFDGVSLMLNGPPNELQQIGLAYGRKNTGHSVQLKKVLEKISESLESKFDVTRVLGWIDETAPKVRESQVTATSRLGRYRLLLLDITPGAVPGEARMLLTIQPAVVVTWRRE